MHSYYISLLTDLIEELGVDKKQLLRESGLQDVNLEETVNLSAAQLDSLFTAALELSGDEQLGIKFGGRINMVPQGILGYAIITSPTIGDALTHLVRYHRAVLPGMEIELVKGEEELALLARAEQMPKKLERLYCEVLFGAIVTTGSILVGEQTTSENQIGAITMELDYSAPYDSADYYSVVGPWVDFNCQRSALCFDARSFDIPISTSNHFAQEVFRRECDRLLPHDSKDGIVSEQVRRLLIEARSNFPSSAAVAKTLHMSESSLRRHLSKEGWRFQQLLDQVRNNLAHEYLQGTQLPVAEIASLLGFSDSANFRRSFKRWSNKTPSQVRAASLLNKK